MPESYDILFASSNEHKYEEAKEILAEFGIQLAKCIGEYKKSKMDILIENMK